MIGSSADHADRHENATGIDDAETESTKSSADPTDQREIAAGIDGVKKEGALGIDRTNQEDNATRVDDEEAMDPKEPQIMDPKEQRIEEQEPAPPA